MPAVGEAAAGSNAEIKNGRAMLRPYDYVTKEGIQTMKTYTFPTSQSVNGAETAKTLAPPTNIRIVGMLGLLGLKSFSEMFTPDKMVGGLVARLDLAIDQKKMKEALRFCLVENCEDVDVTVLDTRVFDDVVQDFFEQRAASMTERMKSSIAG
jgi:hypothetical protein